MTILPSILEYPALLGLIIIISFVIDLLYQLFFGIWSYFLPNKLPICSINLRNKFGSWAVVTGSTDGIGKEYARELASRRINVVLISRTMEKLKKFAAELEKDHKIQTKVIVADFGKGQEIYEHIRKELGDLEVGILVNNVGRQYSFPAVLTEVPENDLWQIININVGAATMMTRMLLPNMLKRKRGAIVNVSSSSEVQPLPLMTVYAATKTYLKNFSDAIQVEYHNSGVIVQHLSPLFVNTKMNSFSQRLQSSSLFIPNARTYAESAVLTLGKVNHSTGYWPHGIQYYFVTLPPKWLRKYVGYFMNKIFQADYQKNNQSKF